MSPPRILLCGDVSGRLNQLYKRVNSVNKSAGPFDALLCVGQFFPDSAEQLDEFMNYVEGRSVIPLSTYFIGDYGVGAAKVLLASTKESGNLGFKMDGLKICENLCWLKGSGKFTLHGLSVAYLSGRRSSDSLQFGKYTQDDVDVLRAIAEEPGTIDLFLTNEWPTGVINRAATPDIPPEVSDPLGSDSTISELVVEIKPRGSVVGRGLVEVPTSKTTSEFNCKISCGLPGGLGMGACVSSPGTKGVFYAREPYSNVDAVHVTRFLGLASVGNKEKQKFIHAISPTPSSSMSASEISTKPSNTTLSPYTLAERKSEASDSAKRSSNSVSESQYWRYDVSQKRQKHGTADGNALCFKFTSSGSCPRGEKCHFQHDMDAREQSKRGVCFDFLNKGKCERGPDCNFKHAFQNEADSQSGKRRSGNAGTNRSKECWFCLSSPNIESHLIVSVGENFYCALAKGPLVPDHILIVPVEHFPNTLSLAPEYETELNKLQICLRKYFKSQGKEVVFFEWVSKRSTHANLQVVPIPTSRAHVVQNIFDMAAEKLGFRFTISKSADTPGEGRKSLRSQFDSNHSFFYVELPECATLSHVIEENEIFPAQYGREVLAGLLNMVDKADWRNCSHSKEEEMKMAEEFKTRFEEFDPNK